MIDKTNGGSAPVARRGPRGLLEEFERYFPYPFRGFDLWPTRRSRRAWMADEWLPEVDVFERDGKFVVRADLPGMKREDIEVKLDGDVLTIRGHREEKEEVKEADYYRCERQTGAFTRTIQLPEGATLEKIEASYSDGVLEVTVPKAPAITPNPIEVHVK